MKKLLLPILLILAVSTAYGAPFAPTPMVISAPSVVIYAFDGSSVSIPVTVSGHPARAIFAMYTKNKAAVNGPVWSGYLGWHYVNKVDTCVHFRDVGTLAIGENTILWDGKGKYGDTALVPESTYNYYIWGFDGEGAKIPAIRALTSSQGGADGSIAYEQLLDPTGARLAQPSFYVQIGGGRWPPFTATTPIPVAKWTLGIDTETAVADIEQSWGQRGEGLINKIGSKMSFDPLDQTMFYQQEWGSDFAIYMAKYKWVPGGAAILQTGWATDGAYLWTNRDSGQTFHSGADTDGADQLYMSMHPEFDDNVAFSKIIVINREDGSPIKTIDLEDWYCRPEEIAGGGHLNGGPALINFNNGMLFTSALYHCGSIVVDPYREPGDEVVWENKNGDYVHDHHFLETDTLKWICNESGTPPWMYTFDPDTNNWSTFVAYGLGNITFGLEGPDGTGIGYFSFAGETDGYKNFVYPFTQGTAFDGLYCDNNTSATAADRSGIWWLGMDSFKGVLTYLDSVAEAAPASFSVAQNTPNPFNPTTTIRFNLAKAGKVTVDVFNISGQKVGTLVNTTMDAGPHSITWNASKNSAGVYFYTVKSENYSKTMKMTLLK